MRYMNTLASVVLFEDLGEDPTAAQYRQPCSLALEQDKAFRDLDISRVRLASAQNKLDHVHYLHSYGYDL
jgi:hypothetical protein